MTSTSVDTPDPRTLRSDGRAVDELRPVVFDRDFTDFRARVRCSSRWDGRGCSAPRPFEDRVPPWMRGSGKGWVTAEYSMLPGSTAERAES